MLASNHYGRKAWAKKYGSSQERSIAVHQILKAFHKTDIYSGFPHADYVEDISGWGGTDAIFDALISKHRPDTIIEVGTWKGQSAITMGESCRRHQLNTAIICVDTWLGSEEHWLTWPHELKLIDGYPTLYRQFLANVIKRGLTDLIVPFPTTSMAASAIFETLKIRAGIVYIDCNHQEDAVALDLKHYYPLVAEGGVLFGHDIVFPGVYQAVAKFCTERGLTFSVSSDFWVINRI